MPDIDAWAGNTFPLGDWFDIDDAVDAARIISDKSVSITVVRDGAAQDAQTVRIEEAGRGRSYQSEAGETGQIDAVILGYKGHPSIDDTDIQRGDRFAYEGQGYEVVRVSPGLPDSLQAYARVRS
jgi:hypothetical protein